ncbi:MAG: hypothetical protein ACREVN_06745 [Gammaproteobacteria bacterium]
MVIAMRLSIAVLMAQNASADMRVVEQSFESSTAVRIPAGDDAPLDMRNCPGCPVVTLRINPETRYFIGDEQVTQADFRKAAARETVSMTVHYDPESRYVTRVIMWPS